MAFEIMNSMQVERSRKANLIEEVPVETSNSAPEGAAMVVQMMHIVGNIQNNLNQPSNAVEKITDFAPGLIRETMQQKMMKQLAEMLAAIREGNDGTGYPLALIFMLLSKTVIETAEADMNNIAELINKLSDVMRDLAELQELLNEMDRLRGITAGPGGKPGIPEADAKRIAERLKVVMTNLIGSAPEGDVTSPESVWRIIDGTLIPATDSNLGRYREAVQAAGRDPSTDSVLTMFNNFATGGTVRKPTGEDTKYPNAPELDFLTALTKKGDLGENAFRWVQMIGHNAALEARDGAGKGGTNYVKNLTDGYTPVRTAAGSSSQTFQMFMTQKSNDVQTYNDIARSSLDDQSRMISTANSNLARG